MYKVVILPAATLSELATCVTAQFLAVQVIVLKVPLVLHVAVPLPVYPTAQVTATVCPVVPLILPAALYDYRNCCASKEQSSTHCKYLSIKPGLYSFSEAVIVAKEQGIGCLLLECGVHDEKGERVVIDFPNVLQHLACFILLQMNSNVVTSCVSDAKSKMRSIVTAS